MSHGPEVMRAILVLVLLLAVVPSGAGAQSVTLNGITFSSEHGGIRIVGGSGSGSADDPFVLTEEIIDQGPAILTIRGMHSRFGNRIQSHHDIGFSLIKIVRNLTDQPWPLFDLELREVLNDSSPYEDGLSFGQGSASGRPFHSDRFPEAQEIAEPFDSVSFSGTTIPPGGTVAFRVVITDTTPRPVFYLFQKPTRPLAEAPPGPTPLERPQLVEERR